MRRKRGEAQWMGQHVRAQADGLGTAGEESRPKIDDGISTHGHGHHCIALLCLMQSFCSLHCFKASGLYAARHGLSLVPTSLHVYLSKHPLDLSIIQPVTDALRFLYHILDVHSPRGTDPPHP